MAAMRGGGGAKIELPGISFSDANAKSMVSLADGYAEFDVKDGYLKIDCLKDGDWGVITIKYPDSQNLDKKNIKIIGHTSADWKDGQYGGPCFQVWDGTTVEVNESIKNKEYIYGPVEKMVLSAGEDKTITSEYGWADVTDNPPDLKKITEVKIYPKNGVGSLYIKSIEFVD